MNSDEEDTEMKIFWGDCNDFLLEQWMESKKNVYTYKGEDYKPMNVDIREKPWMMPGADISDYFNFGFNEDTWNSFLMRQISLRQQKILEKEKQAQLEQQKMREISLDSREWNWKKDGKREEGKRFRR
jgi:hypothetical protein